MPRDPVCRMQIATERAAGKSLYKGVFYHFCAPGCKKMFDAAPDRYIAGNDGNDHPNVFDPVCGLTIDDIASAERCEHASRTYYFCCLGCKQLFNTIPEMYKDSVDDDT